MENLIQPIKTHEGYMHFVVSLATKLGMFAYEVHPSVHELGTETVPYFRLMWSAEHVSPVISFHIENDNVSAIQYYQHARALCPNILLGEGYYTSYNGETFVGTDADIAQQMDLESDMAETTTQPLLLEDESAPAILIVNTPIYHADDPKAEEQSKDIKRRKGFGRFP